MRDPYQVLGIGRGASQPEIKKAYRKLAKENHPDRNADNAKALELFKEANSAYELLSDTDKKARFDRGEIGPDGNPTSPFQGGGGGGFRSGGADPFSRGGRPGATNYDFGSGGGGADDLFSELFGGRSPFGGSGQGSGFRTPPPQKGSDVAYRLMVPFEDAAALKPQRVTLRSGKTLDLKLPAGIESGRQVRMAGQGEPGPAGPGDALVTLEVGRHKFFTRDGDDVRLDVPVTLNEAVQGAKVRMPTVEGAVSLTVPAGTTSGKVFRLKGRGFSRADGSRGDQLVTLIVDLPADDAALKSFVEGWSDAREVRRELGV
ncbi:molecular chaperone DnaJ [Polymorphobacter glacialis]|uniref:Molecular chaperone DnaJ n=1 Tax=Sandarakinorhabdus glacialis TaxID=1614636 RepID=A0A916ZZ36_9SPHN|nr:J domain-containing protein [Polymorphobacter glacialis]GGE19758.1 molecular chaperone DnaJ [Polymorphobacter glacialis]